MMVPMPATATATGARCPPSPSASPASKPLRPLIPAASLAKKA